MVYFFSFLACWQDTNSAREKPIHANWNILFIACFKFLLGQKRPPFFLFHFFAGIKIHLSTFSKIHRRGELACCFFMSGFFDSIHMKFDALFIDLDGTLLTDHHTISAGTKEILTTLHRRNMLICIVTARSPMASLPYYHQLDLPTNPIICFNGSLIQKEKTIVHDVVLPKWITSELMGLLNDFDIVPSVYKGNQWFAESRHPLLALEAEITKAPLTIVNLEEFFLNDFQPNKILGIGPPDKINAVEAHIKKSTAYHLNVHRSKPNYLEIMNHNASKKSGVQKVMELYQLAEDRIITIGDNYNDIDMLRFSKTSIAMGNAPDEVKKCASFVTDTNNNDGIRKAIEVLIGL
jgi:Cof subfamily protein (haloacid dehalogenase superfamily)